METSELAELITNRRSIRKWLDKPVPEEMLIRAIDLATHAPNAGNQQNWFFYVIVKGHVISAIADAVQASAEYVASWPEAVKFGELTSGMLQRSSFFRTAPAAIVVAAKSYLSPLDTIAASRPATDEKTGDIKKGRAIANARIQSVASATAYLLLALNQMGLGAVWMTGPMQAKGEIEKILNVPADMDVVAFIPVGYPAENPALKPRKPVNEVSRVIR